jgi:hypothetical protein
MNDDFQWFLFLAGLGVGIGVSFAAFFAILLLG